MTPPRHLAGDGEQVVAVMASRAGARAPASTSIAFEADEELSYLALGADLSPVHDRRLVSDAVVSLALAERAEEVSGALRPRSSSRSSATAERALRGGDPAEAAAAAEVALGVAASGRGCGRPTGGDAASSTGWPPRGRLAVGAGRVPRPGRAADRARSRAQRRGEVAWRALGVAAGAGDPANFSHSMTATTAAAEALVDDVLDQLPARTDPPRP